MTLILAGDIGGTKTDLALYEGGVETERARFRSHEYSGLEAVVAEFLHGRRVDAAGFAVAGPVKDGRCKTTNLPWEIACTTLAAALEAKVALLNDLAACVLGIGELAPADLVRLAERRRDPMGPIAALGAGTGLGEAIGVPTSAGLVPLASEGGHADFAARTDTEIELLRFLQTRHGSHVSLERALSGPGLVSIYQFVVAHGLAQASPSIEAAMRAGDAAEIIGTRGGPGGDAACARALSIFVALYGAEAGNLALRVLPTGGLFLLGGMAPKLIERLQAGDFMQAMLEKGRMSTLLSEIAVAVVVSPHVALFGARAQADVLYRSG
jgi:glucokinase